MKHVQLGARGDPPLMAARAEWFIRATERALFAMYSGASDAYGIGASGTKRMKNSACSATARIPAPADGTIAALDPDIPPNHQRLNFSAKGKQLRWLTGGKAFARGAQAQWLPWPGRHGAAVWRAV